MISRNLVEKYVGRIKRKIEKQAEWGNYDAALELVSLAANILYETNIYYMDADLERYIKLLAEKTVRTDIAYSPEDERLLFWDGFGLNSRGLIQIYLNALCRIKKVIYVTYEGYKDRIPDVLGILRRHGSEAVFLRRGAKTDEIGQLDRIVKKYRPSIFVHYSLPSDVTAPVIMRAYERKMVRYLINLTDHAFWLGAGCLDGCIEFREYGACVSSEYRRISRERIAYLPYYPIYDPDMEFGGYPFRFDEEKNVLVFSGGHIYKTCSRGNEYYKIVDYILSRYRDAVFWYAGSGDSRSMRELLKKYPGRAYHTGERKDLFQVMRRCVFYLNTYPVGGGLMMQYAAVAGKIPLTLRYKDDCSGILINQDELNVEFDGLPSLKEEIDRLMTDREYLHKRSGQMGSAVISPDTFNNTLKEIIGGNSLGFPIKFRHVDTETFRKIYLERIGSGEFYGYFARRSVLIFRQFPLEFGLGGAYRLAGKIRKCIWAAMYSVYFTLNEKVKLKWLSGDKTR